MNFKIQFFKNYHFICDEPSVRFDSSLVQSECRLVEDGLRAIT